MLTLYHCRTAVCTLKARLALAEKGISFESKLMTLRGDQFDPAYLKINPNAVVPTLVHDGRIIVESTAIMHYLDEAFAGPALMPADAYARVKTRLMEKLVDEYIHLSCITLTYATANRASRAHLGPAELEAELAKAPDPKRSEVKRQVVPQGLDAPAIKDAVRQYDKLLDMIEQLSKDTSFLAGSEWSLADAAVTPYVWRLDQIRLARMWDNRPRVAAWYERVCARPSFKAAVLDWLRPEELQRYANLPDPWPKVSALLKAT